MKRENSVKKWFEKGLEDLKVARYNFKGKNYNVAAFFIQQALEKCLKSVEIKKFERFSKTHDLTFLGKKVGLPKSLIKKCMKISRAYVVTRYPDVEEVYSKKEIEEFFKIAKEVIRWIKKELRKN